MEVSSRDVPGLTLQVCFPAVRASVLDSLNRQREEGQLCDLSIHVQGQVFRAHRCVLAASSPYFHDQVLLKNVTTVSLPSVMDPVAFESVLSSAYTGQLSIVQDDIVNYVTVASFLQMWHIVDKCTEILKRHRPAPDVPPGGTPDALPPLATWRRPQQFPRWGRQRSSTGQQLADSQLECLPAYNDSSDYSSCEEPWVSSQAKPAHIVPDALGHSSKNHGMPLSEETLKQKFSLQQQRGPERPADKNRESGDRDVTQERQKKDRKEREEEKSSGGNGVETKEDIVPIEKESGQVSQRPLVSPEFNLTGSDASWPSTSANQGPCLTPTSSSTFLAPSSPPMPSSSSSLPLTGAPFAGKVHYCHCGKAYALKSMRDRHVKMQHLNLRPFGCPVCNKSFKMKHHLTKHLKTHGGLRPFECSICGKKVIWKDSFLRHQARCQRLHLQFKKCKVDKFQNVVLRHLYYC
uniref:Uncharacterized protein n=1 Tax=Periophthalmus magnuspinnatus TaxID=409849 RepID=A0A3B4AGK9_9GOBI